MPEYMSAREGLLQTPTQVSMEEVPKTGPFYMSVEEEERLYVGRWSDGLFECFSDLGSCLLCSTPCLWPVLLFELLGRLRLAQGQRLRLPLGLEQPTHVVWLYAAAVAVLLFIPHFSWGAGILTARILYEVYLQVADIYKLDTGNNFWAPIQACCCQGCLLARLSRHVGRARGFIPPIMGFRVEAAPAENIQTVVSV